MLAVVMIALAAAAAAAAPLAAQDSTIRVDSAPSPPSLPTPEQVRYTQGLRTVARGVAQLRDGVDRVVRTQQGRDTVQQRRAAQRMGGLCATARSFISSGRPRMLPTAYTDSMRIVARKLVVRIDSILKWLPTCEATARTTPVPVATDLTKRLDAYDQALLAFRAATAPPRVDSIKPPS